MFEYNMQYVRDKETGCAVRQTSEKDQRMRKTDGASTHQRDSPVQ